LLLSCSGGDASRRTLTCTYDTYSSLTTWPRFQYCKLKSIDLSESFKSTVHSFSGTSAQRSTATVVWFENILNIPTFLPKEIPSHFPNLNGLFLYNCNLPTLKNEFFTRDFRGVQYLFLGYNNLQEIEANAFQNLVKLKWISLLNNQIQALPFQLFLQNPALFYIDLRSNKINSINPEFWRNLMKLKFVQFGGNLCVDKNFGCEACLVSQQELGRGLKDCYSNWLSPEDVEENLNLLISNGFLGNLLQRNQTDLLIKKGYLKLLIEKGYQYQILESVFKKLDDFETFKNETLEFQDELKELKQEVTDLKIQLETVREESQNRDTLLKKKIEDEVKALKDGFDSIVDSKLIDFEKKLRDGDRP
jgi:hypothetical protein